MITTAEIDKAGRIIVPKKLRDALALSPGTRLQIEQEGDTIVIRHEPIARGLVETDGFFVHHSGARDSVDLVSFLEEEREARMRQLLASGSER